MEQAFENYVKNYDMNDSDINYKYHHSYRVAKISDFLAQFLSQEDKTLAHIIAIYHDIGRFEQDKLFNSFYDKSTFDHGDYGIKVLFDEGLIKQIPIAEEYYEIIKKAIRNHNKYQIEAGLTKKELLHAKLIRDADKIDILYAVSAGLIYPDSLYKNKEVIIREEASKTFYNEQTLGPFKKTNSEIIIANLALIFDINFKNSLKYIKDNHIIANLYNRLEAKEKYKQYFDYINKYLEKRM